MRKSMLATAMGLVLALGTAAFALAEKTVTIAIEGMHCDKCATSITKKLKATEGVQEATVSFESKEAVIKYDDAKVSVAKLQEVINSTGFKAKGEKKAE